jgi:dCTP deaminase (EC 3.5.4.13)
MKAASWLNTAQYVVYNIKVFRRYEHSRRVYSPRFADNAVKKARRPCYMILTGDEIRRLMSLGRLSVEPLRDDAIRENGLDLRIGREYAIYAYEGAAIRPCELAEGEARRHFRIVKEADEIAVPPRNFVLLTTEEYVKMPNDVVGLANLRSTLARYGLVIPPTVVDAGFEGNITIEVVNESPNTIVLRPGLRFLHLILVRAEGAAKYLGTYLGQRGVTPPKGLKAEC